MKEILSLQFGHYSNFIGTHWWNIQETGFNYSEDFVSEINHDVLYREGITNNDQVTYTPRLLLVDLKGSLKTLPEHGDLYQKVNNPAISRIPWPDNNVEIVEEESFSKNDFQKTIDKPETSIDTLNSAISQQLDNEVAVWSDFLFARFHPRSINIIKEYQHESETTAFDLFPLGTSTWKMDQFSEEFTDNIRRYIEECNSLQGFHITADVVNGFGGLASECLEYIKDEYNKKSVLIYAAVPSHYSDYNYSTPDERENSTKKDTIRMINLALSLQALSEHGDLVIPLCTGCKGWRQPGVSRDFPYITYKSELSYHTSSVIASFLDTISLAYRTKSSYFTLNDFAVDLNGYGRKIASAGLSLPFPMSMDKDLIDILDNWSGPLWQQLTPNCNMGTDNLLQVVCARGISESRLKQKTLTNTNEDVMKRQRVMPAYRCESVQDMLTFYLSCTSYRTMSHVTSIQTPMSVKPPYPNIFDPQINASGYLITEGLIRSNDQNVKSTPAIAACESGTEIGEMLENLHRDVNRIKIARFNQYQQAGLENDTYKEALESLMSLRECYENSFE